MLTYRFEAQHIVHALTLNKVQRWVAMSEGAGGTIGWLTVCQRRWGDEEMGRPSTVLKI